MENNNDMPIGLEPSTLNFNSYTNNLRESEAPKAYGLFDEHGPTRMPQCQNITQCVAVPSSEHVAEIIGEKGCKIIALRSMTNTCIKTPASGEAPLFAITGSPEDVAEAKRILVAHADRITKRHAVQKNTSMQITECVAVPSSEHVAMIVGSRSCNITALLANFCACTTIRIPSRNEDPIFVVTGICKDVTAAKRRLLRAAKSITKKLAARKNNAMQSQRTQLVRSPEKERITIQVPVPPLTVGFIVGRKGETIKQLQKLTNTYIFTPSRKTYMYKEPCFEVTGKPEDAERAKRNIESYIAMHTGMNLSARRLKRCPSPSPPRSISRGEKEADVTSSPSSSEVFGSEQESIG